MAKLRDTLLHRRQDRFKGGFSPGLFGFYWAVGSVADRKLDATLCEMRGKEDLRGKSEGIDATLSDGRKNTP